MESAVNDKLAIAATDVERAAERLRGVAHRTPVLTSRKIDHAVGAQVYFKCENFQRAGAFKFRGAYNFLSQLTPEQRRAGVVAFSSGNHAQGVALAAQLLDVPAAIVMPEDAPRTKLAATREYGAEIVLHDRHTQSRSAIAERLTRERGATLVPPFDHPWIMAGQGTAALELLDEVPELDVLVVPLGGGGLLSGCATIARARRPSLRVYGVETELGNDWWLSFASGKRVEIPSPNTIADGMRTTQPGALTFPVVRRHVTDVLLVSDEQVITALRRLLFGLKILVEPTGAVAAAAVFGGKMPVAGERVGVVISGGNVDPEVLTECLSVAGSPGG
ncbi:MAG: threo-3-hydroxy-L-aspartate ammonia-lyase [Planctomycetota bacterium]